MFSEIALTKITQFEESTLDKLMDILERMIHELLKTEDYLSAKVQSLHRLYLSYLSKFLYLKKNRLSLALSELDDIEDVTTQISSPMNGHNSSKTAKSKRNKNKNAKKNSQKLDLSFIEPKEQPSGLLCPPPIEPDVNKNTLKNPTQSKASIPMF